MNFEEVMEPVPELLEAMSPALVLCVEKSGALSIRPTDLPPKPAVNWALGVFPCYIYSSCSLEKKVMGNWVACGKKKNHLKGVYWADSFFGPSKNAFSFPVLPISLLLLLCSDSPGRNYWLLILTGGVPWNRKCQRHQKAKSFRGKDVTAGRDG